MSGIQRNKAHARAYVIGEDVFSTKEDIEKKIQHILYKYPLGQSVDHEDARFLLAVLQNHPRVAEKIANGVDGFLVQSNAVFSRQRCFYIVHPGGTKTAFSYMRCLYPATPRTLFMATCRRIIGEQLFQFKERYFLQYQDEQGMVPCSITGVWIDRSQSHVDHIPPLTFEQIVTDFIASRALCVEAVETQEVPADTIGRTFVNRDLLEDWREYHRTHARYRVISAFANLSIVKHQHHRAIK